MTGTVATTGTGATTGAGASTPFSMACPRWRAHDGPGRPVAALATAELTGAADVWANYVEIDPARQIVCNWPRRASAGGDVDGAEVNYRGPS
jgi:hypothetical protein